MVTLGLNLSIPSLPVSPDLNKSYLKKCFRANPDLSVVSLEKLSQIENLPDIGSVIDRQLDNGTTVNVKPWSFIVVFDEALIYDRKIIKAEVKVVSTPEGNHAAHYSIVPMPYDHKEVISGNIKPNMYFHLGALYQVYEAIMTNGTIHRKNLVY